MGPWKVVTVPWAVADPLEMAVRSNVLIWCRCSTVTCLALRDVLWLSSAMSNAQFVLDRIRLTFLTILLKNGPVQLWIMRFIN